MKRYIIAISVAILVLIVILSYSYLRNRGISIAPVPDKGEVITVVAPVKDSIISSPLSIAGRAIGTWFFEGSFPIALLDQNGRTIAEGHVSSQGVWQTEELVKFIGTLQFDQPTSGQKGTLVLKKNNPSDLRENDDSYELPIIFK
jgi:hypothetical protein